MTPTSRIVYDIEEAFSAIVVKALAEAPNFEFEARIFTSKRKRDPTRIREGGREDVYFVALQHWTNLKDRLEGMGLKKSESLIRNVGFSNRPDRFRIVQEGEVYTISREKKHNYKIIPDEKNWTRYSLSEEVVVGEKLEWDFVPPEVFSLSVTGDSLILKELNKRIEEVEGELRAERFDRLIKRTSYFPSTQNYEGLARIDLSEVSSEKDVHYEVEIEMLDVNKNYKRAHDFVLLCKTVVAFFRGTEVSYSWDVYASLCYMINSNAFLEKKSETEVEGNLGMPRSLGEIANYVDINIFNQVRTLKKNDLVFGGLVGGKYTYSATYKSDGNRSVLVISCLGVWLIWPPYSYNFLSKNFTVPTEELTILDGESIPLENRTVDFKAKYAFEVLDAILVRGIDVRSVDLDTRLENAREYLEAVQLNSRLDQLMTVIIKPFWGIGSISEFFRTVEKALTADTPCKTDGLIFTPQDHPYWIGIDIDTGRSDRDLKDQPEIVKWKNAENTTIDFRYKIIDGKKSLLVTEWEQNPETQEKIARDIVFVGDATNKFDQETMVDWASLEGLEEDSVAEYSYDRRKKQFVFVRKRLGKAHPNTNETVAIPNWREINSPITRDAITGKSFQLMFFEHTRIKSRLLNVGEGTLLDIGPGRGGPIWHMGKYNRIVAVEPNPSHREKFRQRATLAGLRVIDEGDELPTGEERFVILIAGVAQDTERIRKQVQRIAPKGVNTVSLLDVGTFLWKSEEILNSAMNTIKSCLAPGGSFVWKMMNGDRVRPSLKGVDKVLRYGSFELHFDRINKKEVKSEVKVFIPEGITSEGHNDGIQTEWLTSVDEMYGYFPKEEFEYIEREVANRQQLMTENDAKLSALFEYGVIRKSGTLEKKAESVRVGRYTRTPVFGSQPIIKNTRARPFRSMIVEKKPETEPEKEVETKAPQRPGRTRINFGGF